VNNNTRAIEYPWAWYSLDLEPRMNILEIGGGLSGMQFLLAKHGYNVLNVDPGVEEEDLRRLSRAFKVRISHHKGRVQDLLNRGLVFDRVLSISVFEHMLSHDILDTMRSAYLLLKPGGIFVATIDLFLDVKPFTKREKNKYGTNISIKHLVEAAPFEIVIGGKQELYGFDEFSAEEILSRLSEFFIGEYPCLVQLIKLKKPV
jgi:2-polyprenyl-3-methyl-5-hydroxy-6-metoxy-1,4-benzoquinol methylase